MTGRNRVKVEKRMEEIRKALRKHFEKDFDVSADPLPFMSRRGFYQAVFKIGTRPEFDA